MTNKYQEELRNKYLRHNLRQCVQLAKNMGINTSKYPKLVSIDEYFTEKELIQLKALYLFSRHYKNMSGAEIEEFIRANENKILVSKFISLYPGMIDEMRDHGLTYVCLAYRNNRVIQLEAQKLLDREQMLQR